MIKPVDIAHINLNVTDVERSEIFYRDILGFHVSGKVPGAIVFMNLGQYKEGYTEMFHDLALYQVPSGLTEDYRKRVGMNHTAIRLATAQDVDNAADFLRTKGVKVLKGPLTHSEDHDRYLYFEDPDGNVLELVATTLPGYPETYLKENNQWGFSQ